MSKELEPCSFCGGPVKLEQPRNARFSDEWWGVVCRNTLNRGGTCAIEQVPSRTKEAAIERWNTRVQPAVSGDVVERVAEAICQSRKFENGEGACAAICMSVLGDARKNCAHRTRVHGDLASAALAAMQPQPSSYEDRLHDTANKLAKRMGAEFVKDERWPDVIKAAQPSTDPVRDELVEALAGMLEHACVADAHPEDKDGEDHAREHAARKAIARAKGQSS